MTPRVEVTTRVHRERLAPEDAGAVLDDRAKQAYRRRVEDLEDQLAEAEWMGDRGRASRAREELEAVAEQLASAVGLGGRDRKAASNVERARVNVQRRLKDAIRRGLPRSAPVGASLVTRSWPSREG
jgi:hypothetical protein